MRTTIDLPDDLYRQVKARAALRGMKLKEYVAAALRESLFERSAGEMRETTTGHAAESTELAEDCVLPLVPGETTRLMRSITERKIERLLESDDGDSAPSAG